jgi:hypothetical protein
LITLDLILVLLLIFKRPSHVLIFLINTKIHLILSLIMMRPDRKSLISAEEKLTMLLLAQELVDKLQEFQENLRN